MRKLRAFHYIIVGILLLIPSYFLISGKIKSTTKQSIKIKSENADVWAKEQLSKLSLEEKIGQFFMVAAYSNQGEDHLAEVEQQITKDKVGGIIFFQGERDNLKSAINRFQTKSNIPLFIGLFQI